MTKIRLLIIDDEELARTLLRTYCERLPYVEIVGMCKNALAATDLLYREAVDLLLLDVQMPELTGLEWLATLPHRPLVILTTAYPEYALEGYSHDLVDYLLKPFSFERFVQAINRAGERLRLQQLATTAPPAAVGSRAEPASPEIMLVKAEHKVHRIRLAEISYIQSMREYVAYHLPGGRLLSLGTLKQLEESLPADRFMRVHKSYIVGLDHVETLEGNMLYIGRERIPIGANYRDAVLARLFG